MQQLSTLATMYVRVKVSATDESGNSIVINADTVQFAFTKITDQPVTWYAGSWGASTVARCLVGPAGGVVTLAPDTYQVWIKISDNPETPILKVDTLAIF